MERYLKDEPKLQSYKKLPTDLDSAWDLFAAPARILEELNYHEHNLDSLSTSSMSSACSGVSWDSALSCAVVVKKEKIEEDEDNSDSCEEKLENNFCKIPIQIKTENAIELRLLARATADPNELLPTLTPPSSPESSIRNTTDAELALLGHQGLFKVASTPTGTNHLPRSAIVRITTATKNAVSVTALRTQQNSVAKFDDKWRFIQLSQNIPAQIGQQQQQHQNHQQSQQNHHQQTQSQRTTTTAIQTPQTVNTTPAPGMHSKSSKRKNIMKLLLFYLFNEYQMSI